jgi:hypothetical protein
LIEQGKKHWITVAPILTPIVLAQIRKMGQHNNNNNNNDYRGGGGGGGGGGGRR